MVYFIILRVMLVSARSAMSNYVFMLFIALCESFSVNPKFQYSPTTAAENLCREYKSYFQSLNDAMNNNFVHCSGSTANGKHLLWLLPYLISTISDQCTIPAVEILKPCMQGTTLDQECHKNAYSVNIISDKSTQHLLTISCRF